MRTITEQSKEEDMLTELKAVLSRSSETLIEDALGVVSLFTLLIAGLYLPGLV